MKHLNKKPSLNLNKAFLLLTFLLIGSVTLKAQTGAELDAFNSSRERTTRNGMYVLGGWAIGNITYSGIEYYQTNGTEKYFHQMNVIWNSVNVALAGGSLLARSKPGMDFNKTVRTQINTEKMFLANAALDLVYSSAGLYLTEKAKSSKQHDKLYGWGESLMLQGGFLFLFDTSMCILHTRHGNKKLLPFMQKVQVSTSGIGLKIGIQL